MDIFDNLHSGVLSLALTAVATTAKSGNFGFLPVVTAPNTLRLTLDPSGVLGFPPEIVVVTAHAANSDTVTITRAAETGFGGGPARLWPLDTAWRHSLTRESIVQMLEPAGTIKGYIGATAPAGYLLLDGTAVAAAQTTYPALWSVAPSAWKAGSTLNLPNMASTFLSGAVGGAIGGAGGANLHTLTAAELPASTVAIDPPATAFLVDPPATNLTINPPLANIAIDPPATTILIDPPYTLISVHPPRTAVTIDAPAVTVTTGGESVTHTHGTTVPGDSFVTGGAGSIGVSPGGAAATGAESRGHTHLVTVNIPSFDAVVDFAPFDAAVDIGQFAATVNIPAFTEPFDIPPFVETVDIAAFYATVDIPQFASGPLGGGAAFDVRPAYLAVNYIIKAH